MRSKLQKILILFLTLGIMLMGAFGCVGNNTTDDPVGQALEGLSGIYITNGDRAELEVGCELVLQTNVPGELTEYVAWSVSNSNASVSGGVVYAREVGKVIVTATCGDFSDTILIEITEGGSQSFCEDCDRADSYEEALERSSQGVVSGCVHVPDQAPVLSAYQPTVNGVYVRNNQPFYADENTYVVVNAYGHEIFRVYRGGGYITLEEVAAYVYAFGDVPANYVSGKKVSPSDSIWGEYLRLNHSKFSGSTSKYPYEPELPDISGCGGDLTYYEIDIGTTGTDAGNYDVRIYNDGTRITRGAARIVYARFDANKNAIIDPNEKYVFYTYNHYNDFQEYLNYYGGWGEMFGNITGGGALSSKTDYNPTPYVPVVFAALSDRSVDSGAVYVIYLDTCSYRKEWELCENYIAA